MGSNCASGAVPLVSCHGNPLLALLKSHTPMIHRTAINTAPGVKRAAMSVLGNYVAMIDTIRTITTSKASTTRVRLAAR